MKVLVAVKAIADPSTPPRIDLDGIALDTVGTRIVLNPFDEVAVEAAVRLRETGVATEVVAVSVGAAAVDAVLRTALAMGADRAIRIDAPGGLDSLSVAKVLAEVVRAEAPQLALLGKQGADDDRGDVGPMLAGLLAWPQATHAVTLDVSGGTVRAQCAADTGAFGLELDLPAVITVDPRLAPPRFPALANVLAARKATIAVRAVAASAPLVRVRQRAPAASRRHGVRVADARELVARLRDGRML